MHHVVVKDYNFPVCFDFETGDIANNIALIFGRKTTLNVAQSKVKLLFEDE